MRVEQAQPADLSELVPLFDGYRSYFAGGEPDGSQEFLEERLRLQDSVIFVARQADAMIGFVQLYPIFSSWYVRRVWFLSDLFVADPSRGQGVAQALLEHVREFLEEGEGRSVMVELPRREPHLYKLYERAGYTRDPDFDLYRLFRK